LAVHLDYWAGAISIFSTSAHGAYIDISMFEMGHGAQNQ
jgi:hypothetical protein